jgi:hypothetical protein
VCREWPQAANQTEDALISRSTVTATVRDGMKKMTGKSEWKEGEWRGEISKNFHPATDYKGSAFGTFHLSKDRKSEVKISMLVEMVKKFPQGGDRGVLTEVVELVKDRPELDRNLSQIHEVVDLFAITVPQYGVEEDRARQNHWHEEAHKIKVRFYDTTNRSRLKNGKLKQTSLQPLARTRKTAASKSADPSRRIQAGVSKGKRNQHATI